MDPIEKAKLMLAQMYNRNIQTKSPHFMMIETTDVKVVWFAYILGGWKTLLIIMNEDFGGPGGHYYEVTHNREKNETYIDTYQKIANRLVPSDGCSGLLIQDQPTVPGFYQYDGGAQAMLFLLREDGQWFTCFDNGESQECDWGYIEQALGVWNLVQI